MIKQRDDINIEPTDISNSYVGSSLTDGSTSFDSIAGVSSSVLDLPEFHPGAGGARTMPGEGGFAYADTPQATILLQKKQWVEQEWTYSTGDKNERAGKEKELLTRIALGNLISRKLELLNNYELFTKFNELNQAASGIQTGQANDLLSGKAMADVLQLAGTPVTKYYTENISLTETDLGQTEQSTSPKIDTTKITIATQIKTISDTKIYVGPNAVGYEGSLLSTKNSTIATLKNNTTVVLMSGEIGEQTINVDFVPSEASDDILPLYPTLKSPGVNSVGNWWQIDLTQLKESDMTLEGKDLLTPDANNKTIDIEPLQVMKIGYISKTPFAKKALFDKTEGLSTKEALGILTSVATTTEKIEPVITSSGGKNQPTKKNTKAKTVVRNAFNGVIELGNVSQVNTENSNKGGSIGKASFVLENPNNILRISEDDIEIALGTKDGSEEIVNELGDSPENGDNITINNTVYKYYNGRLYTDRAYSLVVNQEMNVLGNVTTTSKINALNQHIKYIRQVIGYLDIYKNTGLVNDNLIKAKENTVLGEDLVIAVNNKSSRYQYNNNERIAFSELTFGPKVGSYDTTFLVKAPIVESFIKDLGNRINKTLQYIKKEQSFSFTSSQTEKLISDKVEVDYRRSQLRKYYLNKTIFEVYDKVFIWLTSPSRSQFRTEDGSILSEASNIDASTQLILRRIQEIISLLKQTDNAIQQYGKQVYKHIPAQFTQQDLVTINEELFENGESSTLDKIFKSQSDAVVNKNKAVKKSSIDDATKKEEELFKAQEAENNAEKDATAAEETLKESEQQVKNLTDANEWNKKNVASIKKDIAGTQKYIDDQQQQINSNPGDPLNSLRQDNINKSQQDIQKYNDELVLAEDSYKASQKQLAESEQNLVKAQENKDQADENYDDAAKNTNESIDVSTEADNKAEKSSENLTKSKDESGLLGAFGNEPTIGILLKTIQQKLDDYSDFFKQANETKGKSSSSKTTYSANSSVGGFNQGINPQGFINGQNKYAGLEEVQIQTFEGVISSISRGYSNGSFTISIECSDNLEYLERSRYTAIPGLNTNFRLARAILDDPIFRKEDQFLLKNITEQSSVDELEGRWKTGILTLNAQVADFKEEEVSKKDATKVDKTDSQRERFQKSPLFSRFALNQSIALATPHIMSEPFQGTSDPATIISILITGMPFDPEIYLKNALSSGAIKVVPVDVDGNSKDGETIIVGLAEAVRQQVLGQVRKYGNFEPFLERSGPTKGFSKEDQKSINISTALNLGIAIMNFVVIYINTRRNSYNALKEKILKADNKSYLVTVTKNNIHDVLDFDEEGSLPTSSSEINFAATFNGDIPEEIRFLAAAAIFGVDSANLQKIFGNMTNLNSTIKELNSLATQIYENSFTGGISQTAIAKLYQLGKNASFTEDDTSRYAQIISTTTNRLNRGKSLAILFDKDGKPKSILTSRELITSVSTEEQKYIGQLRGLEYSDDLTQLISGNPLQSTKASIIFKQKQNYLAISDEYLKSPNLIDFVPQEIDTSNMLNDENHTVLERCKNVAKILDWELYADSQGHIRFKQPTYNRTLIKHLLNTDNLGIFERPSFKALFDEEDGTYQKTFSLLTYKKYLGLILKHKSEAIGAIKKYLSQAQNLPIEQKIGLSSIFGLPAPANILGYIISESKFGFDIKRLNTVRALMNAPVNTAVVITSDSSNDKLQELIDDPNIIFDKISEVSSQPTDNDVDYFSDEINPALKDDIIKVDTETNNYETSLKQTHIKAPEADPVSWALVNIIEDYIDVCIICSDTLEKINTEMSSLEGEVSTRLQDLTDERFIHIIPNAIIINERYSENKPEFTRLNIHSTLPMSGMTNDMVFSEKVQWAGSVDYDLWRTYGYITSENIPVPFIKNNAAAAIYAHILMARQYSKILNGNITVRGDSKYQVGDTVFIEDENTYFYVTEVKHSFQYEQGYTTSLTLEYGRAPGQYIPYPFDILGDKMISNYHSIYSTNYEDTTNFIQTVIDKRNEANKSGS